MPADGVDDLQLGAARQLLGQLLLQTQRVQPVRRNAAHHHRHRAAAQRLAHPAAGPADVVTVQRLGQHHVAARVEPLHQLDALVLQITLHRVPAAVGGILVELRVVAEPGVELDLAAVGQMREAPRDRQPGVGRAPGVVIIAALPIRIGFDRRDLGALGADLIGGRARAHRQQQPGPHPARVTDDPLQSPCAAHGSTHHGGHLVDAQGGQRRDIGLHLIANRDPGKP